jgi:hypothetical protein
LTHLHRTVPIRGSRKRTEVEAGLGFHRDPTRVLSRCFLASSGRGRERVEGKRGLPCCTAIARAQINIHYGSRRQARCLDCANTSEFQVPFLSSRHGAQFHRVGFCWPFCRALTVPRKPISLISHSDVRYRGILAGIDPAASTIQLSNGPPFLYLSLFACSPTRSILYGHRVSSVSALH